MSFLSRLFSSSSKDDDYETILAKLASDIQKRRVKLSEIRLRERRAALLVTFYMVSAWLAYVSMWYFQILPFGRRVRPAERFVFGIPVVIGPVVVMFVRRIVQIWYNRIGNVEEKTLIALEKNRREKVEEIKKKTNYYSTRDLLQKYDEGSSSPQTTPTVPQTPKNFAPRKSMAPPQPLLPQTPKGQPFPGHLSATPGHGLSTRPRAPGPPVLENVQPVAPSQKQWYDRLVDAVLGADDGDSSKYALICERCFKHNGLIPQEEWETKQYQCPKCHHLNQGPKVKRQSRVSSVGSNSPQSISEAGPRKSGKVPIEPGDIIISPTQNSETEEMDVDRDSS